MEEKLQFMAAELLITIQDKFNASQKIINHVRKGVDNLFNICLDILMERFTTKCDGGALSFAEITSVINTVRGHSVFQGLNSTYELEDYLKLHEALVPPVKVVVSSKQVIRGDKIQSIDVDFGYMIPFIPSLEQVLSCPEVMNCVKNPQPVKEGVFTSALDGYVYQNHPLVKKHGPSKVLAIGIYSDSVNLTDTASSKSGAHGVTYIYWILLNIHPDKRSSSRAVFLLGCVKTSVLKEYGYSKFMEDFVAHMNRLLSGVEFNCNGVRNIFYAVLIFSSGDNPGSANFGGYKESAGLAEHPCRQCLVSKTDLYSLFEEDPTLMRCMADHVRHLEEIEEYRRHPRPNIKDPSVAYGVNRRSVLMSIEGCDVTKCFPQDFMHDTVEGTLKLEICCLLSHVLDRGEISLTIINERIKALSKFFGVNRPSIIDKNHIDNRKLRQTASETLSLAYILPFALKKQSILSEESGSVCDSKNLECFILRLRLLDLVMSRVLTLSDIQLIQFLTKEHHIKFMQLYPNEKIPKIHFEIHMGTHALLYGPFREFWCFRFEGKHALFKRLMRTLRCLKNPVETCAVYHQRRQGGLMLLSAKGDAGPYLRSGITCGAPTSKQLKSIPSRRLLSKVFPNTPNINEYKVCVVNGVRYRKKEAVLVSCYQNMPVFGEVLSIFGHEDKVAFVLKKLITVGYDSNLNAFKVDYVVGSKLRSNLEVVLASEMKYHHRLPFVKGVAAHHIAVPCKSFIQILL